MDISQLSKRPQLIELVLDNKEIVEQYGEPIKFWMMDSLGLTTYFNFYKLQNEQDDTLLYDLLRKIVLNEQGQPAIKPDEILPVEITMAILVKITDFLGKSTAKISTQNDGTTQK